MAVAVRLCMSTIGDLCKRKVVVAKKDESLLDAARRMRDQHVGCLVVVAEGASGDGVPVGMLSDRDIVTRALAQGAGELESLRVADVMSKDVVTAFVHEDVATIASRMRYAGVRRLPVLGENGALIGIIAHDDLLTRCARELQNLAQLIASEQRHERQPGDDRQVMRD
jgi:CBS domain-containing protein